MLQAPPIFNSECRPWFSHIVFYRVVNISLPISLFLLSKSVPIFYVQFHALSFLFALAQNKNMFICLIIINYWFTPRVYNPLPQGVVPAAEPAHGCSASLYLRCAAGPQPRRRLDGPGDAIWVVQPATRCHQVLHQCHTQQGLHQHHRAGTPHQMPAGGWGSSCWKRILPADLVIIQTYGPVESQLSNITL